MSKTPNTDSVHLSFDMTCLREAVQVCNFSGRQKAKLLQQRRVSRSNALITHHAAIISSAVTAAAAITLAAAAAAALAPALPHLGLPQSCGGSTTQAADKGVLWHKGSVPAVHAAQLADQMV